LHVLSLPLAFILSQDQTLHCKWSLILTINSQELTVQNRILLRLKFTRSILIKRCCCFHSFKDLLFFFLPVFPTECKGKCPALPNQTFFEVFLEKFSRKKHYNFLKIRLFKNFYHSSIKAGCKGRGRAPLNPNFLLTISENISDLLRCPFQRFLSLLFYKQASIKTKNPIRFTWRGLE
jgi:hypothetical protein